MRLTDYVMASSELKKRYFDTVTMQVGLRYFGGKNVIGKYLINRIFEMQAYRYVNNNNADIQPAKVFIDCFTGGGKMALSIPTGWFDTIVMNDYNYGVYSYYKCCQIAPLALIKMIENLGRIMCLDVFMLCARLRSTRGKNLDKDFLECIGLTCRDDNHFVMPDNESVDADMLLSGAMTYWVTQGSWLGETDPESVSYAMGTKGKNEAEEIRKRIRTAKKRIYEINQKMCRQHYIIENMDYVDLLKKYLGEYGNDKLCIYLDPPYHAATLNKSNGYNADGTEKKGSNKDDTENTAPYEDTFEYEQTNAMTYLLATLKWFIKSDYDPYYFFRDPNLPKEREDDNREKADFFHDFDLIENMDMGFYREYLGSFHKGTSTGHDEGMEVIWSRYDGSQASLKWMNADEEDWEFWFKKKSSRMVWLPSSEVNSKARLTKTEPSEEVCQGYYEKKLKEIREQHRKQ